MEIQTDDPLAAGDAAGKLNRSRSQRCDFNDAIRLAQLFLGNSRERVDFGFPFFSFLYMYSSYTYIYLQFSHADNFDFGRRC